MQLVEFTIIVRYRDGKHFPFFTCHDEFEINGDETDDQIMDLTHKRLEQYIEKEKIDIHDSEFISISASGIGVTRYINKNIVID